MDRKVKLNGVAITGQTLLYTKIPNLILGDDAGYQRGDILDANAVALKINEVIGGAPEALDTLKELADAMQDNPQLITDMKNQIDPFFTPNQNNKIDTYGDLKDFFDDTTPEYNYTKDTTILANTLIYDSVNNVWGIREGDPILEYASSADYAWIDFGNGNEGRIAICRNTPDYTNSPVIRLDDTYDCKLCLTLNADGTFGTISVQDNAVPLSYNLCNVYAVDAEPYFKTFEARMDGKVDSLHIFDESTQECGSIKYDDDDYRINIYVENSDEKNTGIYIEDGTVAISNSGNQYGYATMHIAGHTAHIQGLNTSGQPTGSEIYVDKDTVRLLNAPANSTEAYDRAILLLNDVEQLKIIEVSTGRIKALDLTTFVEYLRCTVLTGIISEEDNQLFVEFNPYIYFPNYETTDYVSDFEGLTVICFPDLYSRLLTVYKYMYGDLVSSTGDTFPVTKAECTDQGLFKLYFEIPNP